MSEKVVLPRFDLPRDTTRLAIRAAWAAGGLMVVATLVLGMALYHRRSVQLAAGEEVAARAEAARRAALAPPAAPKPAVSAPVAALGKTAGKSDAKTDTTLAAVAPATASEAPHRASAHGHHGGKVAGHGRAVAHAGNTKAAGRPAGKAKVDDDFIDKLLSK